MLTWGKTYNTSIQPQLQLSKYFGEVIFDHTSYRRLIRRLLYLIYTRHDIAYTVSKLSQFFDTPTTEHMLVGIHVFKYLKQ